MNPSPCNTQHTHMQDALRKRVPAQSRASYIERLLGDGYLALQEYFHTPSVSLQYLEAVAGVRLSLSVLAQELKSDRVNSSLLRVARDLCMDTRVNVIDPTGRVDTTGPVLYLMRLLVRQFGFPSLRTVSQSHPWVVPETLRRVDNVSACSGWVIVYLLLFYRRRNQLTCLCCMSRGIKM